MTPKKTISYTGAKKLVRKKQQILSKWVIWHGKLY